MSVTVYGASDDLVEVEGDISAEWSGGDAEDGHLIGFSNGVLLSIVYDRDGFWRIRPLAGGDLVTVELGDEDTNYSDRATVEGDIAWATFGSEWRGRRG